MPTTEKELNCNLFDQLSLIEEAEEIAKKENAENTLKFLDQHFGFRACCPGDFDEQPGYAVRKYICLGGLWCYCYHCCTVSGNVLRCWPFAGLKEIAAATKEAARGIVSPK